MEKGEQAERNDEEKGLIGRVVVGREREVERKDSITRARRKDALAEKDQMRDKSISKTR